MDFWTESQHLRVWLLPHFCAAFLGLVRSSRVGLAAAAATKETAAMTLEKCILIVGLVWGLEILERLFELVGGGGLACIGS